MELTNVTSFCFLFGMVCLLSCSNAAPEKRSEAANDEERRATWLETRDAEIETAKFVYEALQTLVKEGLVNPDAVVAKPAEKRGRHQGFCFRKTKSGRFLPYICWKDEGEAAAATE